MIRRLPVDAPVRKPDSDADLLRIVASAANEIVDVASHVPAKKVSAALEQRGAALCPGAAPQHPRHRRRLAGGEGRAAQGRRADARRAARGPQRRGRGGRGSGAGRDALIPGRATIGRKDLRSRSRRLELLPRHGQIAQGSTFAVLRGLDDMKTFAASVAVWGALVLAGLYLGVPDRLLYWSGVAPGPVLDRLRHGLAVPPDAGPPSAADLGSTCPLAEQGPEHGADQDRENEDEGGSERHGRVRRCDLQGTHAADVAR